MILASDVRRWVQHDFSDNEAEAVCSLFLELQETAPQIFSDRILRCILFLADGSLPESTDGITLARSDYREVIVSAEYDRDWQQIRDFSESFDG